MVADEGDQREAEPHVEELPAPGDDGGEAAGRDRDAGEHVRAR